MDIEHDLLFAAFALRGALLDQTTLHAAFRSWSARKDVPLADVLVGEGAITADDRTHIEYLLRRHLERHHNDTQASLAEVADPMLRQVVTEAGDSVLAGSVAGLPLPPPVAANDMPTRVQHLFGGSSDAGAKTPPAQRYRREKLHAAGGIGQVWLARDTVIGRDVALKELRPETAQVPEFRERFLDEACITGQLEHPSIVPVYELVQPASAEEPYYVMRFVKGRTLSAAVDEYHTKKRAGRGARVELLGLLNAFHAVCNALAYAHVQRILHRDLKGLNVILGDFGEVIVLDWGLARRLGVAHSEHDSALAAPIAAGRSPTLPGQVMGTPGYMAPEQAAGQLDQIDERTDVYGLGAILYEILTGQAPFSGASMRHGSASATAEGLTTILQRIQTESPKPPRHLSKDVPFALEAVCLKALARHREDRYPTAGDLARDVQRWLADEPVTACREPLTTRLGRWGRRHRMIVTGCAVLLVCAVIGLAVSTILVNNEREKTDQARVRADQERENAVQARRRAERNFGFARNAVKKFFYQISEDRLLNVPSLQPLRKELLKNAKEHYESLVNLGDNDPEVRGDLGMLLLDLALVTSEVSERDEALSYLKPAEDIFTVLAAEQPAVLSHRHHLGRCHLRRGYFLLLSRVPGPQTLAELERARAMLQSAGDTQEVRRDLAQCANNIGAYYDQAGVDAVDPARTSLFAEAIVALGEAERGWRALIKQHPRDPMYRGRLAGVYQNFGKIFSQQGKYAAAHDAVKKSLELHGELLDEDRTNLENQSNVGNAHSQLAICLRRLRQPEAAAVENDKALKILEPLAQKNETVIRFQIELSHVYFNLAYLDQERLASLRGAEFTVVQARARSNFEKALVIYEALNRKYPHESKYLVNIAGTYANLGHLAYTSRKADALRWYNKAIPLLEKLVNDPDGSGTARPALVNSYWGRAEGLDQLGEYCKALADWERVFALQPQPSGSEIRIQRAWSRFGLATVLARRQDHVRAVAELEALATEDVLPGLLLVKAGRLFKYCAALASESGQQSHAERYATRATDLLRRARSVKGLDRSLRP